MLLVPLSADGRVTAAGPTVPVPGPLRVALDLDGDGVRVVALGPSRPVGRLGTADAAAYAPVVQRLAQQGLVGTCPARITPSGALVLDLAPASECVLGNSVGDLVLLTAEKTVTVTREEHHQDVLAGRGGRVAVALRPCTIAGGKYAGQRGVEVALDGRRVGELTRLMSERYLPMIDDVAARARQAGCEALLRPNHRGMQVELRLPAVDANAHSLVPRPRPDLPQAVVAPHAAPPPSRTAILTSGPGVRPASAIVPPPPAPSPAAQPWTALDRTAGIPGQRAVPTHTTLAPARFAGPEPAHARPGPRRRRARQVVLSAVGGVVGVLMLLIVIGSTVEPVPRATPGVTAAARSAAAVATATSTTPTSTTPTSAPPTTVPPASEPDAAAGAGAAVVAPAERTTRTSTRTTTRTTTAPPPATKASPTSTRRTTAAAEPAGCHPSYDPCLPVGRDLDCSDVSGPVRVKGRDEYRLDGGGTPGIGCE